jgi:pilus assembly protein CpaF
MAVKRMEVEKIRSELPGDVRPKIARLQKPVKPLPDEYFGLRARTHQSLLDLLDPGKIELVDTETLKVEVENLVMQILNEGGVGFPLAAEETDRLVGDIIDEVLGFGPLEPLLRDHTVSDILINGYRRVYVERFGTLEPSHIRFNDDDHLMRIIRKIVSDVGRHIDESSPMVDARLPDGSRVNAIIPPLAVDGPMLSIRRFAVDPLEMKDLISYATIPAQLQEILKGIVVARLNVLISGGTGSGKTTLLNVLSRFIPERERIVTIEDSAELQLKQDHLVRLETRPPNIEGKGEIAQRDLVINSLRMRPDRIIVGEVRGKEAFDMLQAMNTGHDGSLTTVHANSPRDALMRLETMVAMTGMEIPNEFVRRFVSSAIDVVIHVARMTDGTRKLTSLQEVTGMEGDIIALQEVFSFERTRTDQEGRVRGKFRFHGIRPRFMDRFNTAGIRIPDVSFDPTAILEV